MELNTVNQFQKGASRGSATLVETLAALIIGGIGMGVSIMGLAGNNLVIYGLGIAIMTFSAMYIGAKAINEILDLIDRFKGLLALGNFSRRI